MEEFYRKLKVGMKLKYAFTTVIVTFAVAMVVSIFLASNALILAKDCADLPSRFSSAAI